MLALKNKLGQKAASAMVYGATTLLISTVTFALFVNTDTPLVIVSGSSMTPALNPGDAVLIYQPHISELNVNDVVAFKSPTTIVVHRVIDKHVDGNIQLVTKGDFNLQNDDDAVTENNYVGKVYLAIPKLGVILNILKNPAVMALLVVMSAAYAYFRAGPALPGCLSRKKQA